MNPVLVESIESVSRPGKRALDLLAALAGLVATLPFFVVVACASALGGGPLLARSTRLGRWSRSFSAFRFGLRRGRLAVWLRGSCLAELPALLNVLVGDMSLVGPRARRESDPERPSSAWGGWSLRPGMIGLWDLRKKANMDFDDEDAVDEEYALSAGLSQDLGILCRALPYLLVAREADRPMEAQVEILGLTLDNPDMDGAVDAIARAARDDGPRRVVFVNAHCANVAYVDAAYCQILHRSDLVLADGIGMRIAGKLLGGPVRQNVNGTDLFPRMLERCADDGLSVYLLGARPGVADEVARWARQRFPKLDLRGAHHGYLDDESLETVKAEIRQARPDLLFVAMGVPIQERWLAVHLADTGASVGIAVGGLFDFFSGTIPRAPLWMRELGLEWLFRLCQEPRRMWKRYVIGNLVFLWHVFAVRYFGGARL